MCVFLGFMLINDGWVEHPTIAGPAAAPPPHPPRAGVRARGEGRGARAGGARALGALSFDADGSKSLQIPSVQKRCQVFVCPEGALRLAGPCRSHGRWLGGGAPRLAAADGLFDSAKQVCDGEQGPGVTFTAECKITSGEVSQKPSTAVMVANARQFDGSKCQRAWWPRWQPLVVRRRRRRGRPRPHLTCAQLQTAGRL